MVAEFHKQLEDNRYRIDNAAWQKDLEFIKAMLRFRIDEALYGIADARRHLIGVDPQAQGALRPSARRSSSPDLGARATSRNPAQADSVTSELGRSTTMTCGCSLSLPQQLGLVRLTTARAPGPLPVVGGEGARQVVVGILHSSQNS